MDSFTQFSPALLFAHVGPIRKKNIHVCCTADRVDTTYCCEMRYFPDFKSIFNYLCGLYCIFGIAKSARVF